MWSWSAPSGADEGKGKIVDWLSEQADVVVRFQGGHNAGHTLVIDGADLQAVAAAVRRGAAGQAVGHRQWRGARPASALLDEIARLSEQGVKVTPDNLRIAENVTLILPLHQELDALRETRESGQRAIGTTKRGIGPAYEDKVGRRAIRLMDLADLQMLDGEDRAAAGAPQCAAPRPRHGRDQGRAVVRPVWPAVAPRCCRLWISVWSLLDGKRREGKRILFEGAQGALLDIDHGTYPYVTSSNTVAAQAATGSGLGPNAIDYVLGICKAYTTRVGEGPFLDRAAQRDRQADRRTRHGVRHGDRPPAALRLVRRGAGAADRADQRHQRHRADQARHSRRLRRDQGLRRLSTSTAAKSTICRRASTPRPASSRSTRRRRVAGQAPPSARSWAELPAQAIKYVRRIEELVGCPVALLSTSPEREDTDPGCRIRSRPDEIGPEARLDADG